MKIARGFYVKDLGKIETEIEKIEKAENASLESFQFYPIQVVIPGTDKKESTVDVQFAIGVTLNKH